MRTLGLAVLVLLALPACTGGNGPVLQPAPDETPLFVPTRTFESSFESIDDFDGFYIVPQNHFGTSSHAQSAARVHSGTYAHKAWVYGANPVTAGVNTNHRGYPTVQLYKTAGGSFQERVRVTLWVWLDMPISETTDANWFSFATLTSYADDYWFRSLLVNLHQDGYAHFMHTVAPGAPSDLTQETMVFPQREWVELQVDLTYPTEDDQPGYAELRQNGALVSATRFYPRFQLAEIKAINNPPPCLDNWNGVSVEGAERLCGLRYDGGLAQAHFGLYAPPLVTEGAVFNDDLRIEELVPAQ